MISGEKETFILFLKTEMKKLKDDIDFEINSIDNGEKSVEEVAELYKLSREAGNPVITWVLERRGKIKQWQLEEISINNIYSEGINPKINDLLNKQDVNGNFLKLWNKYQNDERCRSEFSPLKCDLKDVTLICVEHRSSGRDGEYELLDGAHRLMGAIASGAHQINAYVAKIYELP